MEHLKNHTFVIIPCSFYGGEYRSCTLDSTKKYIGELDPDQFECEYWRTKQLPSHRGLQPNSAIGLSQAFWVVENYTYKLSWENMCDDVTGYKAYHIMAKPKFNTLESFTDLVNFYMQYDDLGVMVTIDPPERTVNLYIKPEYVEYRSRILNVNFNNIRQVFDEMFSYPERDIKQILQNHNYPCIPTLITYLESLNRADMKKRYLMLDPRELEILRILNECYDKVETDDFNKIFRLHICCHEGTKLYKEADAFIDSHV